MALTPILVCDIMSKFKALCIIVKCEECGKEHPQLIPLVISEKDWRKTQELHGEMISEIYTSKD
jgi:hypothetical protein